MRGRQATTAAGAADPDRIPAESVRKRWVIGGARGVRGVRAGPIALTGGHPAPNNGRDSVSVGECMAEVLERLRARIEDLRRRVPSIAKAERVVGYRPRVPLGETPRRVLEFLRASGRR